LGSLNTLCLIYEEKRKTLHFVCFMKKRERKEKIENNRKWDDYTTLSYERKWW